MSRNETEVVQTHGHQEEGSPVALSGAPWWYRSAAEGAPVFIQKAIKDVRGIVHDGLSSEHQ